jgi:Arc/MetJ-type ribon-helix-helix transcriptional regulator
MTTVRLPADLEQRLEIISRQQHKSKTEIIREALEQLLGREEKEKDSYELGIGLFGYCGSGDGSLSVTYKQKIKEKLYAQSYSD